MRSYDDYLSSSGTGCSRCSAEATCIVDDAHLCDECGGEAVDVAADTASQDEVVERTAETCGHELTEVLSVNGRNLDGAIRVCAYCGVRVGLLKEAA